METNENNQYHFLLVRRIITYMSSSSSVFIIGRDIKSILQSAAAGGDQQQSTSSSSANPTDSSSFSAFEKEDFLGETNQKALRQLLDVLGFKIKQFKILYDKELKSTGVFVDFDKEDGAKMAVESFDGEKFFDFLLGVHSSVYKRESKPKTTLADFASMTEQQQQDSSSSTETNNNNNNILKQTAKGKVVLGSTNIFLDSVNFSTTPHPLLPFNHLMPAALQLSRKLIELVAKILDSEKEKKENPAQKEEEGYSSSSVLLPLVERLNSVQKIAANALQDIEQVKAEKIRVLDDLNNGPSRRIFQKIIALDEEWNKKQANMIKSTDDILMNDDTLAATGTSSSSSSTMNKPNRSNPLRLAASNPISSSSLSASSSSPSSSTLYFSNVELDSYLIHYILDHLINGENLPVERWALAPSVTSYDPIDVEKRRLNIRAAAKEKMFSTRKIAALLVQLHSEEAAAVFLEKVFRLSGENKNFIYSMNVVIGDGKGGKATYLQRCLVWTFDDAVLHGFIKADSLVKLKLVSKSNCIDDDKQQQQQQEKEKERAVLPHHSVSALFGSREASDLLRDLKSVGI